MGTRLSAYGGFAFVAILVAGFILDFTIIGTTSGPPQLYAATIGADLVRSGNSVIWRVELWAYIAALVPFLVFLPGLRTFLGSRNAGLAEIGWLSGLGFIVLHTFHNIAYAAIVDGLAPSYLPGTAAGVATEQVARGLVAFAETAFLPGGGIGGAVLVTSLVACGVAQRRGGMSRLGQLALVAAALNALGYIGYVVGQISLVVALGGWVLFLAWCALTARAMMRATVTASAKATASSREARSSGAAAG